MIKKISLLLLPLIAITLAFTAISDDQLKNLLKANDARKAGYRTSITSNKTHASYANPTSLTPHVKTLKQLDKPVVMAPAIPLPPPPTTVTPVVPAIVHKVENKVVEKGYKSYELDQLSRLKKAEFVNEIANIDYHTQNPPKKLYDRSPSIYNKHLPPVYFKSYYLSLAFKAAERNDNDGLNAVLAQFNFLNGQNKDGDTILMSAIQHNSINVARLLIAKGAYVDAVNHRKRTALHYAATLGELNLIKLLLSMGADYTLTDDHDMTAIDYAHANQQPKAAEMIQQYIEQNKFHSRY